MDSVFGLIDRYHSEKFIALELLAAQVASLPDAPEDRDAPVIGTWGVIEVAGRLGYLSVAELHILEQARARYIQEAREELVHA
jgi:hypothetical protein